MYRGPFSFSISLFIYLPTSIYLCLHLSIIYISICLYVYVSVCLYLFIIYLSIRFSVYPSISLDVPWARWWWVRARRSLDTWASRCGPLACRSCQRPAGGAAWIPGPGRRGGSPSPWRSRKEDLQEEGMNEIWQWLRRKSNTDIDTTLGKLQTDIGNTALVTLT